MKRVLLLAALAVASASGCGAPSVSKRDLVELASGALVSSETALLDFGTRYSRPHLVSGWSEDETATDGTSFVWATGPSSRLRLFIAEPRPLALSFRSWPFRFPGAPPNDSPSCSMELRSWSSLSEIRPPSTVSHFPRAYKSRETTLSRSSTPTITPRAKLYRERPTRAVSPWDGTGSSSKVR